MASARWLRPGRSLGVPPSSDRRRTAVKTRIRNGLQKLRGKVALVAVGSAVAVIVATGGVLYHTDYQARQRILRDRERKRELGG